MRRLTGTELLGKPADTLLEAVSYCSGEKEQEREKPGKQAQLQFVLSPWKWQFVPLGPNAVHMYTGLF